MQIPEIKQIIPITIKYLSPEQQKTVPTIIKAITINTITQKCVSLFSWLYGKPLIIFIFITSQIWLKIIKVFLKKIE